MHEYKEYKIEDIKLSKETVEEFRAIWKEEFQEEISYEQAELEGKKLVHLFSLIYRPLPSDIENMEVEKNTSEHRLPSEERKQISLGF